MSNPGSYLDNYDKGDVKVLNTAPKIIAFAVLPIVFIFFMIFTLSADHLSSVVFGVGLLAMVIIEICRRVFKKAKVRGDVLQDATTSLSINIITGLMNNLLIIPIAYLWMKFLSDLTPMHLPQRIADWVGGGSLTNGYAIAITLAIAIVCADFLYYWAHHAGHRVELFWASHSVHHSSEHYNPTTATRISFFDELWDLIMMSVMCLVLGIGPLYALGAYAVVLLYQLPMHQTWTRTMPKWYEFFFNTPDHHRAHHAMEKIYIDKNFGGITIVWDRIFGTYVDIDPAQPPSYGLTVPVGTFNPFKVLFIEFAHMGKNLKGAKSIGEAAGYVFKQPYWKPSEPAS